MYHNSRYKFTRLLGSFAPILYFNCEHFLVVQIVRQKQTKKFADLKKIRGFSKFHENRIFEILILYKPSLGLCLTKNLCPICSAVLSFIGHKQTNKQTDTQAKYSYRRSPSLRFRGKKCSQFYKSYVFFNFKLFLFNGNLDFLFFSLI